MVLLDGVLVCNTDSTDPGRLTFQTPRIVRVYWRATGSSEFSDISGTSSAEGETNTLPVSKGHDPLQSLRLNYPSDKHQE